MNINFYVHSYGYICYIACIFKTWHFYFRLSSIWMIHWEKMWQCSSLDKFYKTFISFIYIVQQFRSKNINFKNVSEKAIRYFIRSRALNSLIKPELNELGISNIFCVCLHAFWITLMLVSMFMLDVIKLVFLSLKIFVTNKLDLILTSSLFVQLQWKGSNRKQSTRWQHVTWLKASAFCTWSNKLWWFKTQQLILGTGTAIWWLTEPHWYHRCMLRYLLWPVLWNSLRLHLLLYHNKLECLPLSATATHS